VFWLTQKRYPEAIKELQSALKYADRNPRIHNDLGSAYFEQAKTKPKEKRFEDQEHSLEEFSKATELDGNLLEALFNKSLALELGMPREAKASWTLYLQKDSSSAWADEARKHLAQLENAQILEKPDEQVLSDFLAAYRNHDEVRALVIHNETKGLLREPALALQLSRRYLTAKQQGNEAEARESLEAIAFIGKFEQAQHSEFFFLN
jgi:tetratricopeptide (TPR) repeat protein